MTMAKQVSITLVDDLDGSAADETVTFGLDGTTYEIDLNKQNAAALRDALARYVGAGTRLGRGGSSTSGSSRGRGRGRRTNAGVDLREVRDWARSNGHQVSDRGRVSSEIMDAFNAAH